MRVSSWQRGLLWLYRMVERTGPFSTVAGRRALAVAYTLYKRHVEDPFYHLARRHPELFAGGHILDVGANIGYTATVFASAVQSGFRVWAFEPGSENFARLEESIRRQDLGGVIHAKRVALSDHVGTMELALSSNPADHRSSLAGTVSSAGQPVEVVDTTTVDAVVADQAIAPVALIKIDVQGFELSVCRGMAATLAANPRAAVVVEYAPALLRDYGVSPVSLSDFFSERGYRAFRVTKTGELVPIEDRRALADDVPEPGYIDVLFSRQR